MMTTENHIWIFKILSRMNLHLIIIEKLLLDWLHYLFVHSQVLVQLAELVVNSFQWALNSFVYVNSATTTRAFNCILFGMYIDSFLILASIYLIQDLSLIVMLLLAFAHSLHLACLMIVTYIINGIVELRISVSTDLLALIDIFNSTAHGL
jgi:hypothetical protein